MASDSPGATDCIGTTCHFEADTPAGKRFDVALLWAIVLSVLVVLVGESVARSSCIRLWELRVVELVFTGLFTVEYILRLLSVKSAL